MAASEDWPNRAMLADLLRRLRAGEPAARTDLTLRLRLLAFELALRCAWHDLGFPDPTQLGVFFVAIDRAVGRLRKNSVAAEGVEWHVRKELWRVSPKGRRDPFNPYRFWPDENLISIMPPPSTAWDAKQNGKPVAPLKRLPLYKNQSRRQPIACEDKRQMRPDENPDLYIETRSQFERDLIDLRKAGHTYAHCAKKLHVTKYQVERAMRSLRTLCG